MDEALKRLCKKIKYNFQDRQLLVKALTHSSYVYEKNRRALESNERLEFLGDSVLQITVSEYLFKRFSARTEGELTVTRAAIVCKEACADYANDIGLGEFVFLGRCETSTNERSRMSILADAFEALLGAMYLDGGFDCVRNFMAPILNKAVKTRLPENHDYKTRLQEITQRNKAKSLSYAMTSESGPAHDRLFYVDLLLNGNVISHGSGKSKKEAEQMAAKMALDLMGHGGKK